jgi:hypothetical protein
LTNSTTKPEIHTSSVAIVANPQNWRKVIKELIGDEPVTYDATPRDILRRFPIITIKSEDKDAIARIQTKAAEVE